jgi:hypothetical protein
MGWDVRAYGSIVVPAKSMAAFREQVVDPVSLTDLPEGFPSAPKGTKGGTVDGCLGAIGKLEDVEVTWKADALTFSGPLSKDDFLDHAPTLVACVLAAAAHGAKGAITFAPGDTAPTDFGFRASVKDAKGRVEAAFDFDEEAMEAIDKRMLARASGGRNPFAEARRKLDAAEAARSEQSVDSLLADLAAARTGSDAVGFAGELEKRAASGLAARTTPLLEQLTEKWKADGTKFLHGEGSLRGLTVKALAAVAVAEEYEPAYRLLYELARKHPAEDVQRGAMKALGESRDPKVLATVGGWFDENHLPSGDIEEHGARAWIRLDRTTAFDRTAKFFTEDMIERGTNAHALLYALDKEDLRVDPRWVDRAIELVGKDVYDQRSAAMKAIAQTGDPRGVAAVVARLGKIPTDTLTMWLTAHGDQAAADGLRAFAATAKSKDAKLCEKAAVDIEKRLAKGAKTKAEKTKGAKPSVKRAK